MNTKQKIQKLLRESLNNDGMTDTEWKLFKVLKMQNFNPDDMRKITVYLTQNVGLDPYSAYSMFLLYKYNLNYNGSGTINRVDPKQRTVRTSNKEARYYVESLIPFKASNTSGSYQRNGNYVVWSYDWYPIFVYDGDNWYENSSKYSVTTSKQTSQLRPYRFPGEIIDIPHSEIKNKV